jgi:hypothetical protein
MHCHPNGTMDESELDKRFTENFRQRLAGQQMLLLHHEIVPGKPPATGTGVNAPVYLVDARYQTREFGVNDAGEITTEEGVTLTAQELLAPLAEHWPVLDQNGAQWYVTVSTTGTVNCTSSTVNTRTIMSTAFRWAARRSPNNTLWHLRPSTGGVLQAVTTQPSTGPGITAWIQLNDANGLPWVLEVSNAGAISATRVL